MYIQWCLISCRKEEMRFHPPSPTMSPNRITLLPASPHTQPGTTPSPTLWNTRYPSAPPKHLWHLHTSGEDRCFDFLNKQMDLFIAAGSPSGPEKQVLRHQIIKEAQIQHSGHVFVKASVPMHETVKFLGEHLPEAYSHA